MTRHEYDALFAVYQSLVMAAAKLGDILIQAGQHLETEDAVNDSLERIAKQGNTE